VQCDPSALSKREKRELTWTYTRNIAHLLGVNRDVPAPDMGTDGQTMAWMVDAYGAINGYTLGIVTRDSLPGIGLAPEGTRVVIHGFGNV